MGALPKTGIGLTAFCMVNGMMMIVSSDGSVDKLRADGTIAPIYPNSINDRDLLPTCVGMGHLLRDVRSKEVFPRKVVRERLIRKEKIKFLKRKSLP